MSKPPLVSYAQNLEDVMLWRALKNVSEGFFVDVGANSPEIDSVTKLFYDNHWNGINIEPLSPWIEQLHEQRPRDVNLKLCASDQEAEIPFLNVIGTGLSTADLSLRQRYEESFETELTTAGTRTLTSILDEYKPAEIHFMKVDVEGMEYEVLNGCDFTRFRPWVVLVESTKPQSSEENHHRWETLLTEADYDFLYFDGLNRFYGASERSEALTAHFKSPPNALDGFVRREQFETSERLHQSQRELQETREILGGKQDELNEVHVRLRDLLAQRAQLEAELAASEAHNAKMHASTSWRLTQPLRWLGGQPLTSKLRGLASFRQIDSV